MREPFKTQAPHALKLKLRFSDHTRFMKTHIGSTHPSNKLRQPLCSKG
jgi:hypothetical protein